MTRSPIFWFAAGAGSLWAFHKFVKPMSSNKTA